VGIEDAGAGAGTVVRDRAEALDNLEHRCRASLGEWDFGASREGLVWEGPGEL
jgi:hypothetical protein